MRRTLYGNFLATPLLSSPLCPSVRHVTLVMHAVQYVETELHCTIPYVGYAEFRSRKFRRPLSNTCVK